jgi:mannosyltransferase
MSHSSPLLKFDQVPLRGEHRGLSRAVGPVWALGALAGIGLAALLVRLVGVGDWGLWTDEALTIVLSKWSFLEMVRFPLDPTPPLYYALHGALIGSDATAAEMRAISTAAGVAAVLGMYVLGRLCFGTAGGLVAAALLAVWTSHVEYSQEARAYALLFLLSLVASIGVVLHAKALHEEALHEEARGGADSAVRRRLGLALFALASILSFYTHVVSALWIALTSLIVVASVMADRRRGPLLEVAVAFTVMAVLALPGLRWLYLTTVDGQDFAWLKQADLARFVGENANAFLPSGLWDNALVELTGRRLTAKGIVIAVWTACLAAGLLLAGRQLLARLRERPYAAAVMAAYLSLPVLVWGLGWFAKPIFMERTILSAVPGMILLLTGLCLAGGRTWALRTGAALVAVYAVSTLVNSAEKQDWRGAAAFLAGSAAPGDLIAVCPAWNFPAIRHAAAMPAPAEVVAVFPDGRIVQMEAALGTDRAWDTSYHRNLARPGFEQKFGTGAPDAPPPLAAATARIEPGRSIWRLDGHCYGRAEEAANAALARVDARPKAVWREQGEDRPNRLAVIRYLAGAPVTFDIERPRGQQ